MANNDDDSELVRRANAGDADALEQLYVRHRQWVMANALRFCGEPSDAADVAQEAFARFFARFPGFELTGSLRGYLYVLTRNAAISLLRKRRRVVPLAEATSDSAAILKWVPPEPTAIDRLVADLPLEQRQVVLLRFAGNLRLDEIADALELPLGTVKSRLHNALKRLRINLEQKKVPEA